ncbi:MAG: SurA N-terminal domain-containing protein [Verrucomicrobia bacterium]|nr:SurA N-terminal domain-containing protein [Verrucomicrobiota bacterium]
MAMLITRFHKLIQSKVIWYIILGVIVVSFVGFFTPTMRSGGRQQKVGAAGELFGKKVSRSEYDSAKYNSYVWYILSSGRMLQMTDELNASLRGEAWRRLVVLRKAQAEKIPVTDKEVIQQIQTLPLFCAENGAFDINIYKAVIRQLNLSPRQVEELFREQLTIYKMMYRPMQAALISSQELKKAYQLYTDRFILDYVVIPRAQVEKTVTVSKEAAMALFAQNPEAFRMPPKVRVSYVEFPVSNFLAKAEVPAGAAQEFYNKNIEDYRIANTNGNAEAEYKAFDKVEGAINKQLKQIAARKLAVEKAGEFVVDVAPKAEGKQPDFKAAATASGLKIKTLPAFGLKEELKGIDATAPFCQAAFSLENDPYSSFSDPVAGKDTVYVLSLEQRLASFLPTFDVVADEVTQVARKQAVSKALAERAMEIEQAVAKAMGTGAGFKTAVTPFGLKVQTTAEFDLSTKLKDQYADTLVQICLNVQQGKLCAPAPVETGVLLACVTSRISTDADVGLPAIRQELVEGLSRNRAQRLAAAWQESLLSEAKFKDLTKTPAE